MIVNSCLPRKNRPRQRQRGGEDALSDCLGGDRCSLAQPDVDFHKAATAIAKCAGRVVVETLNVASMMLNRRLARAIADAGMAGFLAKLEYKCLWYGIEFMKADQWFASSKLCSHCGWKNDHLRLSDREWWCGGCGVLNERDQNAAVNLANWPGLSFPVTGRGDRVSPAMPAVVGEASRESGYRIVVDFPGLV